MRVLYLITARAGSRRVPNKNLRALAGISLVGFKALAAKQAHSCARLIISTDSQDIQEDARRYGVEVPFTRPADLATDTASSADVIRHAMDWIERHDSQPYDAIMLLEPSAPFARATDFDAAVTLMGQTGAQVVLGMRPARTPSMFLGPLNAERQPCDVVERVRVWEDAGRPPLAPEFTMNGALYLVRWRFFREHGRIYRDPAATVGYVMDAHHSVEIDEPVDLAWAEFLIAQGHVDVSHWKSAAAARH